MILNSSSLTFLVIGSEGQVGSSLCELLASREIPFQAIAESQLVNVSVLKDKLAENSHVSFVVNALFEEPPQGAQPDLDAWLDYGQVIAQSCAQHNQTLIQLSSALVFSGKSTRAYLETDECDASTALGLTFAKLEENALQQNERTIVLRASWLFSEQVDNFLTSLVGAAIRQETLRFADNLKGCPTDAHAVAKVFVAVAEQIDCGAKSPPLWGIYHYADSDACSMHTFAKTVITVVKSMSEVRVENIETLVAKGDDSQGTVVENFELGCKKILSAFGIKQRPWRRSVHEVLKGKFSSHS